MEKIYDDIRLLRRECKYKEASERERDYSALKECLKDIEILWPNEKPDKPKKGGWESSNIMEEIERQYPSKKSP